MNQSVTWGRGAAPSQLTTSGQHHDHLCPYSNSLSFCQNSCQVTLPQAQQHGEFPFLPGFTQDAQPWGLGMLRPCNAWHCLPCLHWERSRAGQPLYKATLHVRMSFGSLLSFFPFTYLEKTLGLHLQLNEKGRENVEREV